MDIMELGAIGELVGGVAVVATLVYLAVQVRQGNRQASRDATALARDAFPGRLCALGESNEQAEILRSGLGSFHALTPAEALRFNSMLLGLFAAFGGVFDNHVAGLIPEDEFEATEGIMARFILTPGGREWWEQVKSTYPTRLVDAIDHAASRERLEPITSSWPFLAT